MGPCYDFRVAKRKKRGKEAAPENDLAKVAAPSTWNRPFAKALEVVRIESEPPPTTLPPPGPATPEPVRTGRPPPKVPPKTPPKPAPVETSSGYSYEDRSAFQQAFSGVRPLNEKERTRRSGAALRRETPELAAPPPEVEHEKEREARDRLEGLVSGGVRFKVHRESDGYVEGLRVGASDRALRAVTARAPVPEATLDLHGYRSEEAARELSDFVRMRHREGARMLLVVHGKGLHSEAGLAVLGERVITTLTTGGAAGFVDAFASAPLRLGGNGALLVRLRDRLG